MYQHLTPKGVRIPNGFAVTAYAYRFILDKTGASEKIRELLADLDTSDMDNLADRGHKVRSLIRNLEFPPELRDAIIEAYANLEKQYGEHTDVAVRSSATAEDLPDASFAGQQDTYLNIHGAEEVIDACKRCFASLFTNRAISYRQDKDFDHFSVALSISVQKMVRSDLACSGVMFSIDTESGFRDAVFLTGAYGLGENVVQGAVNPDEWYIFKPTLKEGKRPILMKKVGEKEIKMVYTKDSKHPTKNVKVAPEDRKHLVLSDDEVLELAQMACKIEDHYSEKRNKATPMDMEWAKDGVTNELFIVQARPETVHSQKDMTKLKEYQLKEKGGNVLISGKSVGELIGSGKVHVIKDAHNIKDFKKGEVLVTDMTDPDWEPIMKIASAIVTNRGGRTCHAAIISRELGIPCVVGTNNGTDVLKSGQDVTVDCSQGSEGLIYEGLLDFDINELDISSRPETKTKIMMNLGSPEQAFEKSFIPNAGVGLAREEFIINSYIKVHPLALLRFDELQDESVKKIIADVTFGYENKADYFVDKLAEGIGTLAAAFYPKKVIVRLSDFKSNEYANLIGGRQFEPEEDNPMIGWRGASRYYSEKYKEAFSLECRAILKVRNEMGLDNLEVMIPFPRTVDEARKVIDTMAEYGLRQGENGLRVIGMCEIPANVILAEDFLEVFDGFSIGTNDLTQLLLGVDRDSELVAHVYDERNEAVKRMVKWVIETANNKGKYIGICGQAPSDYPEFAEFVVECGIQTMSLNPDTVIKTTLAIAELEQKLGR
jgi:pyruvate,water dikinase